MTPLARSVIVKCSTTGHDVPAPDAWRGDCDCGALLTVPADTPHTLPVVCLCQRRYYVLDDTLTCDARQVPGLRPQVHRMIPPVKLRRTPDGLYEVMAPEPPRRSLWERLRRAMAALRGIDAA